MKLLFFFLQKAAEIQAISDIWMGIFYIGIAIIGTSIFLFEFLTNKRSKK